MHEDYLRGAERRKQQHTFEKGSRAETVQDPGVQ